MLTWQLAVTLLSLGVAVAAVAVAIVMGNRSAREMKANEQRLSERIEVLENELSAMMDGAFGVANHLQKVESNLKNTVQRQEQLQQRDMGNLPYNEAVRLASKGASVDELVEHCSLSRAEAELVEMLHKKSPPMVDSEREAQNVAVTFDQPENPVAESTSATEQDLQNLMAEHRHQQNAQPLITTLDDEEAAPEQSIAPAPESADADQGATENTDEQRSFEDALANMQEGQPPQRGPFDPTPSDRSINSPEEDSHSDDRH